MKSPFANREKIANRTSGPLPSQEVADADPRVVVETLRGEAKEWGAYVGLFELEAGFRDYAESSLQILEARIHKDHPNVPVMEEEHRQLTEQLAAARNKLSSLLDDQKTPTEEIAHRQGRWKWVAASAVLIATAGSVAAASITPPPGIPHGSAAAAIPLLIGFALWWWAFRRSPEGIKRQIARAIQKQHTEVQRLEDRAASLRRSLVEEQECRRVSQEWLEQEVRNLVTLHDQYTARARKVEQRDSIQGDVGVA